MMCRPPIVIAHGAGRRVEDGETRVVARRVQRSQRRREVRDAAVRRGREVQRRRVARRAIANRVGAARRRAHGVERPRVIGADAVEHDPLAGDGNLIRARSADDDAVDAAHRRTGGAAAAPSALHRGSADHRLNLPKSSGRSCSRYSLSCSALNSVESRAPVSGGTLNSLGLFFLVSRTRAARPTRRSARRGAARWRWRRTAANRRAATSPSRSR